MTVLVGCAAVGWPIYVRPQIDPLRQADAIFVLGGTGYERYPYGVELAKSGYAKNVVFSNPSGDDDGWLTAKCAAPRNDGIKIECFVPDPPTTKGEGRKLRDLAAERGWHTIIAITYTPHVSRARFILQRCWDGDLIMAASPDRVSPLGWVWAYVYQTAGYIRAAVEPGC
nr:YdcF family protein [Antrihabitans stalactiti]